VLSVESLDRKRSRLRKELQDAYGDWLAMSAGTIDAREAARAVDTAGCPESRKAKVRLVPISREGRHHQDP